MTKEQKINMLEARIELLESREENNLRIIKKLRRKVRQIENS